MQRREYEAPSITMVPLMIEEAVLRNCKTTGGLIHGPLGSGTCSVLGIGGVICCSSTGS